MKRIISLFLSIVMLLSITSGMNLTAYAENSKINIGDYIYLGSYYNLQILWRCVDIDENGPLMLSDKILCLKAFDAAGDDDTYHNDGWGYIRKSYGSNCWSDSSLRQWLNASDTVNYSHCPPIAENIDCGYNAYADEEGFLSSFTDYELPLIKEVTQSVIINEWETNREGYCDGGSSELNYSLTDQSVDYSEYYHQNVTDKIFLLGPNQANAVYRNLGNYLTDAYPTENAVKNSDFVSNELAHNKVWKYWLNVARNEGASYEIATLCDTTGIILDSTSKGYVGVRPAFYLNSNKFNGKIYSTNPENTDNETSKEKLLYGYDSNSFGETIVGSAGDMVKTLLVINGEFIIRDVKLESENTDIVQIKSIEYGIGNYVSFDSEEYATVNLIMKKPGTTSITVTAPSGKSITVPVVVSESDYSVMLYSYIPTMVISKDCSIGVVAQLTKNGQPVNNNGDFTVTVSDDDIIEITDVSTEEDGMRFNTTGKSTGFAKLTVTDNATNAVISTTVQVIDGIVTYNATALPKYKDRKLEYNGYTSGMYIADYSCEELDESYSLMKFDVYNTTSLVGAVDVYDSNGKITASTTIDRFDGNCISSFKDTIVSGFNLVKDIVTEDAFTYKQASYSKATHIEIKVPKGGRVEITNNPYYSDSCMIYNAVEYLMMSINTGMTLVSSINDLNKISGEISKQIFKKELISGSFTIAKDFKAKLVEKVADNCSKTAINSYAVDIANDFSSVFEQHNIDFEKLVLDAAATVGVGIVESALTKAIGMFGLTIKGMFIVNDYTDYAIYTVKLLKSDRKQSGFSISVNGDDGQLIDNGVSIDVVNGQQSSLAQSNFVMHSVVLSDKEELNQHMRSSLDSTGDKYLVRNIYLERDGKVSQPGQPVRVTIPIPEDFKYSDCYIFWVQDDGTLNLVESTKDITSISFITDHFSYYAIVEHNTHNYNGGKNCTVCGIANPNYTDKPLCDITGHYYKTTYIEPTCTTEGYAIRTCEYCGYTEKEVREKLGHSYILDKTIAATCTNSGTNTYICSVCNDSYTETIDKIGHNPLTDNAIEPTCTTTGLTQGSHCSVCGETIVAQETIPAINHNYSIKVNAPTCIEKGYREYTCQFCSYSYKSNYVNATGHNFGNNQANCSLCGIANPNYIAPQPTTPTQPTQPTTPATPAQPTVPISNVPVQPAVTTPTEQAPAGAKKVNGEWLAKKQKNAKIKKLTKAKKSFKATWKKVSGVKGYQIQYSTSKKFTKKTTKSVTIKNNKTTSKTVKKLKAKKKYYVRIRTYKNVKLNGKTIRVYSSWTKAKTVKTK